MGNFINTLKEIGYTDTTEPFCDTTLKLIPIITQQSSQISQGTGDGNSDLSLTSAT